MGTLSLLNHLLNFLAPALAVAVLLALAARYLMPKLAKGRSIAGSIAINFASGSLALLAGLLLLGRDGHMLTYTALVLATATAQWLWLRGWRG
nr:hypothetical protein [Melaminivora sp.]